MTRHYAGNFPLWLAPDQVRVITLNDDEALIAYAQPIVAEFRANMVRVDADFSATPFKAKISNAEQLRVHPAVAGQVTRRRVALARQSRRSRSRSAGPAR